ncbi:hypothetical protein yfred0001_43180 [Yersinia frederiksenii ATCC 33641]|nr:hypothetical protein CRN75_08855 [Yersinia frederiksenii]EEQ13037.1 hypothetical protein yfred0001_43180 [Yersinia frederiksenii ATCC 33641]
MLSRIFKNNDHREMFLDGKLYMNPLGFFRKFEENEQYNIADRHEGAYRIIDPYDVTISSNGNVIDPKNIIGRIVFNHKWTDCINVFCMTLIPPIRIRMNNSSSDMNIVETKCYYGVLEGSESLGSSAVIINDVHEFVTRIKKKLDLMISSETINEYRAAPIEYYSENGESIRLDTFDFRSVFLKNSKYSHQQEYRIAIDRLMTDEEIYVLEIGDLRDISWTLDSSDRRQFEKVF